MRKITLLFSLLLAVTVMAQGNEAGDETLTSQPTYISSLENFQKGWYQIKTGTSFSTNAENKYVLYKTSTGSWTYSLDDSNTDIRTFIYIEPTSENGNTYSFRNIDGTYATTGATSNSSNPPTLTPQNLTLEMPESDGAIKISDGGNTVWSGWYLDYQFIVGISSKAADDESGNTHHCRFYLYSPENNPSTDYDIYTVSIIGAPTNMNPTVTYNVDSYTGISEVYNGGAFFLKDTSEEDIKAALSATEIEEYDVNIEIQTGDEGKTITVTYDWLLEDAVERIDAACEELQTNITAGKVGYPKKFPEEVKTALAAAKKAIENSKNEGEQSEDGEQYLERLVSELQEAYNNIWANTDISNIYLPEDGKVYTITSVLPDNLEIPTKRYVYSENGSVKCTTDAETAQGKNHFVVQSINGENKLTAADGSGYYSSSDQITEDKKSFFFDARKAEKMGHIMLVVDNGSKYISFGTSDNEAMGQYTASNDNPRVAPSYFGTLANNTYHSTEFVLEEVPMPTSNEEDGEVENSYNYTVNLTRGHNREDVYSYYGTLYLPFAVTLPKGVKAYMVKPSDDWTILEEVELSLGNGNTLPAGTPVLLKGEIGEEETSEATAEGSNGPKKYTFTIAANAGATATVADTEGDNAGSSIEDNGLRGVYRDAAISGGTIYILALTGKEDIDQDGIDSENEVRFFRLNGNEVNGNKAYYLIPAESGASLATIALSGGNRVTTIENAATTTTDAGAACYDLSGRQVTKPAAGLYIVGGKKVFVK